MLFAGGLLPIGLAMTVMTFANGRLIPTLVLGTTAVVVGAFCFALPRYVPGPVLQLLAPFGTVLIGAAAILNASAADGSELLYIWPVLFASYFLSLGAGLANVALIAAIYPPIAITLMGSRGITPSVYLVGTSVVTVLIVANLRRQLEVALRASEHDARTDRLTGLTNRRGWDEDLARESTRQRAQGWPMSLLVIDLDHFKKLNDTLGHAAGDAALTRVADVLRSTARTTDVLARLGGEEFGVILPGCPTGEAARIAEELRCGVEAASQQWEAAVTISIGVACLPDHAATGDGLVRIADEALYAAKRSGRNRVAVSGT
jgi:diguanylate cyclase (GGDEF)-like protein